MVDLGAHCFPSAAVLDGGGATWELVLPFPLILEPSSFVWGATEWASYAVDLVNLFFSVAVNSPMRDMSGWTGHIGLVNNSLILVVSVYHRIKVGLTLPSFRSNWLPMKSKTCLGYSSDFSMFTSQPRSWQRATSVCVCCQTVV